MDIIGCSVTLIELSLGELYSLKQNICPNINDPVHKAHVIFIAYYLGQRRRKEPESLW